MNDRQIRCFLAVSQTGSFTKAAEQLYLPQPAISRYIVALEKELGVSLFVRENNRHFYLSEEGKYFYNLFLRFITELDRTMQEFRSDLRPLRLGYHSGWNLSSFLPEVIEECHQANETFSIDIQCLDFGELISSLTAGKNDAIIMLEDYCLRVPEIQTEHVTQISRYIVYSRRKYPVVHDPADFYEENFLLVDDPKIRTLSEQLERYCAPYHFIPKLKAVSNIQTVIAGIENGLGVAFLDEWTQGINAPDMGYYPIGSQHDICLAWKNGAYSQELYLFSRELKKVLSGPNDHH